MQLLEALFLGFLQGITEFLPISSSGHLIIAEKIMGIHLPGLTFEVFLHLASLLAVLFYFRKDILRLMQEFFLYSIKKDPQYKSSFFFSLYLLVATLVTGVLGVALEDFLGENLKSMTTIGVSLLITGAFLLFIEKIVHYGGRKEESMTFKDALVVGLAQTVAVIPGISRAGSTLVASLWLGLEKETAVRFSFLLSIPVILGSGLLMIPKMDMAALEMSSSALAVSFLASFFAAVAGIKWLIVFLEKSRLSWFAYYCLAAGLAVLFFLR